MFITQTNVILINYLDLYQVISEHAPDAIKAGEIKNHFGRKVAIVRSKDVSHSTYVHCLCMVLDEIANFNLTISGCVSTSKDKQTKSSRNLRIHKLTSFFFSLY